jgi:predicted DNA-binding transcriptional regulator AlpA
VITVKKLLTDREVADLIGMSVSFLRQTRTRCYREKETGPPIVKTGKAVRYDIDDVMAWIEKRKRS